MRNYIVVFDENGNDIASDVVRKSLSNLERFRSYVEFAKRNLAALEKDVNDDDLAELKEKATDFYNAWHFSSTEVIEAIGVDLVRDLLSLYRRYPIFTWSYDAFAGFEEYVGIGFANIPDDKEFHVFRGQSQSNFEAGKIGFSWTIDRNIAEWYASRIPDGTVIERTVQFKDIMLFQTDEMEVVIVS